MKSGFYCTNLKQINSRKLLNLLFKHMFTINGPKMAIIIPIIFQPISPTKVGYEVCGVGGREKGKLVTPKREKGKLSAPNEKRENGGKDF